MDESVRVTLFKNSLTPSNGKNILVSTSISKEQLLHLCSQTLEIKAKKVFSAHGTILTSFGRLEDGSVLYISQGENFQVRTHDSLPTQNRKFVLSVLGAAGVGKSAVIMRYVSNRFVAEYDPTIEDYFTKNTSFEGDPVSASILDTAGMEDYRALKDHWIDRKEGFVLIYSVDIASSVTRIREDIAKIKDRYEMRDPRKAPVIVIAANKVDKPSRFVSEHEGQALAAELGVRYFEISAKSGHNIEEMFTFIIRTLRNRSMMSQRMQDVSCCASCVLL
jgi:small GTP-binding protein